MSEGDVYSRFAANLERTERMPCSGLTAYRDGLLTRLVSFAHTHSPFFRRRLEPLFRTGEAPDLQAWHEVSILRRSDLERDIDRINPAEPPRDMGDVTTRPTSGTTGTDGMAFRICALVRIADACMMQDAWSYPGQRAPHYSLDLRTPTSNMIEWLVRHRPQYLLTFPSVYATSAAGVLPVRQNLHSAAANRRPAPQCSGKCPRRAHLAKRHPGCERAAAHRGETVPNSSTGSGT